MKLFIPEMVGGRAEGLLTYTVSAICFMGALVGLWMLIEAYVLGRAELDPLFSVLALVFGLGFVWFIPRVLTTKIEVSIDGLTIKQFSKEQQLRWSEIAKVYAGPTFFGGYGVAITKPGATRNIVIPASMFANGNHLTKAIFEAAYKANPNVELAGWVFLNAEGHPPYGIFPEAKPTAPSRSEAQPEARDHESRAP